MVSSSGGTEISPPPGSSGSWGRKKLSMKLEVNRTEINENAAGKGFENSSLPLFPVATHPTQLSSSQQRCGVQTPSKDCSCYQMFFQLL